MEEKIWTYIPHLIPPDYFIPMLDVIRWYCKVGSNKHRSSCIFYGINDDIKISYNNIPSYSWEQSPLIVKNIYNYVNSITNEKYDYVLIHIYVDGSAGIGYHTDIEAQYTSVASVSLGATRKFRFKKIGRKKGWDHEIYLKNGDFLLMHGKTETTPSFQKVFVHSVPIEKRVKLARINLTFRKYE